jgi:predicted nucleic acid-binding protein/antitoxin (DNA-binding transcriptional repressor) of toxin-antitoxin stability system
VLEQVSRGDRVTVTVNGNPVAEIGPVHGTRPLFFTRDDLASVIARYQADAGLAAELERLAGDTTDDLDTPVRHDIGDLPAPGDRPGLLDTSAWIAQESGRRLDSQALPDRSAVCVVTMGELQAGVLAATDTATRARRLATVGAAGSVEPLAVTSEVARRWAELRVRLAEQGRRAKINDLWIAAVAMANDMDVVTQDDDFDPIEAVGGPRVIRV